MLLLKMCLNYYMKYPYRCLYLANKIYSTNVENLEIVACL